MFPHNHRGSTTVLPNTRDRETSGADTCLGDKSLFLHWKKSRECFMASKGGSSRRVCACLKTLPGSSSKRQNTGGKRGWGASGSVGSGRKGSQPGGSCGRAPGCAELPGGLQKGNREGRRQRDEGNGHKTPGGRSRALHPGCRVGLLGLHLPAVSVGLWKQRGARGDLVTRSRSGGPGQGWGVCSPRDLGSPRGSSCAMRAVAEAAPGARASRSAPPLRASTNKPGFVEGGGSVDQLLVWFLSVSRCGWFEAFSLSLAVLLLLMY